MLSIATSCKLFFAEAANLKRSAVALFPVSDLAEPSRQPIASAWSPDGSSLYLASAHSISRYDASGSLIKTVYDDEQSEPIYAVIAKDKGTLIFAAGSNVHSLEHSASASSSSKIVHTLPSHPDPGAPVIALSLSNDSTLLAVASAQAVLIHNLSLGAHTILRGLPTDVSVQACVFHPHSRVRLFLGIARELVVYDITRPSGPSRVIPMSDSAEGDVVAIACSPYSKTLLAVACAGGYIAMVDLDKEKGRIRSFNYNTQLTSLAFTPDGATLFIGTASGQLLVQTLRTVESPKTIEVGERVESLAITKKAKSPSMDSPALKQTLGSPTAAKPLSPQDVSRARRLSTKDSDKLSAAIPFRRTGSPDPVTDGKAIPSTSTPVRKRVSSTTVLGSKKAFDAARSLFASVTGETPKRGGVQDGATIGVRKSRPTGLGKRDNLDSEQSKSPTSPALSTGKLPSRTSSTRPKASISTEAATRSPAARSRTTSAAGSSVIAAQTALLKAPQPSQPTGIRTRKQSTPLSPSNIGGSKSPTLVRSPIALAAQKLPARPAIRSRTTSTTSRTTATTTTHTSRPTSSSSQSARTTSTRATSVASTARERSPAPPVPPIPAVKIAKASERARTPSPELLDEPPPFDLDGMPTPPRKGLSMLGLGTPEIARWIDSESAHKGKESAELADVEARNRVGSDDEPVPGRRERAVSMQLTPRRSTGGNWVPSPLRNSIAGGSPGTQNVQSMLHALIKDAMLDVRQDIKGEMVGLHLDLVRMGRAWRQEMRGAMEEYVGDLRELREENKRLRDENERLRRGY